MSTILSPLTVDRSSATTLELMPVLFIAPFVNVGAFSIFVFINVSSFSNPASLVIDLESSFSAFV